MSMEKVRDMPFYATWFKNVWFLGFVHTYHQRRRFYEWHFWSFWILCVNSATGLQWTHFYRPQQSCGKVIFSQASVRHSVHRGGSLSRRVSVQGGLCLGGLCPGGLCLGGFCLGGFCQGDPRQRPPCMVTSGWYASYWNAFLLTVQKRRWFRYIKMDSIKIGVKIIVLLSNGSPSQII